MYKKFLALFLCVSMGALAVACAPQGDTQKDPSDAQPTETPAALLPSDATDEELLDAVKDDIHTVAKSDFDKTVTDINENTVEYAGQIYQFEGVYSSSGDVSYIIGDTAKSADQATERLPLEYLKDAPEEGAKVRMTGIINMGDVKGENVPVLQLLVVEKLD